jgi:hypothetical protein
MIANLELRQAKQALWLQRFWLGSWKERKSSLFVVLAFDWSFRVRANPFVHVCLSPAHVSNTISQHATMSSIASTSLGTESGAFLISMVRNVVLPQPRLNSKLAFRFTGSTRQRTEAKVR